MRKILILASACITLLACNNEQKPEADTQMASAKPDSSPAKPQSEFADARYAEWGKKQMVQFETGDMDGWLSGFADNAVYRWSSGDSLAGKAKIAEYWKKKKN